MATLLPFPGRDGHREFVSPCRRMSHLARVLRELASRDDADRQVSDQVTQLAPTTGELVTLAGDRNPYVRSGAVWWLRNHQGDVPALVVNALRAAIHDPNAHVVQAALGTAGVLRLAAARDDARASLTDSNPGVIHSAIFALGRIGPTEEGAHLVRFLGSKEQHLEIAAVTALANLRYRPAVSALISRLERCRGVVRRARSQFEVPRRYVAALVAMRATEVVPLLIDIARDEIGLRGIAVHALIELRASEAGPALLPLLDRLVSSTHEEKLTCSLLHLMTAIDYRFALPTVRALLGHRLAGVRCAALRATSRWNDQEAVATVRTMIREDVSAFVRPVAVSTLGDLVGADALPDLEELVGDANSLVRAAVAEVLGKLQPLPGRGRDLAVRLSADDASPVVRLAREILERVPGEVPCIPVVKCPVPEQVPVELHDQVPAARAFLARWRAGLGGEQVDLGRALDLVLQALTPAEPLVR